MWRLLERGEILEHGDEFWTSLGWQKYNHEVGRPFEPGSIGHPSRRRIPDAPKPCADIGATVPDPGEGYRLIDKLKDKPERGDQYWNGLSWVNRAFGPNDASRFCPGDTYRRKVVEPAPAPVVKTGDLVGIDSGTWQGCTGRVTRIISMTLVRIQLDNVLVGGLPLAVCEPLENVTVLAEPVVDPEWRLLEIGETRLTDDEFASNCSGAWKRVGDLLRHGKEINSQHVKHRRRVRIESPGWRYLDAGEVVKAGDETEYSFRPFWRPAETASTFGGRVMEGHEKFFRRKTVPFAG
jgi:hypothetical protein